MIKEAELNGIWEAFFKSKREANVDLELKKKLIGHYYHLVKIVANRLHQKISEVQPDELASMGVDGLYDAVANYDKSYNTKFETYAMHRIRGSMYDAIRKADWVPRLVRAKCSQFDKQRQIFESQAGRKLSNDELAELMSIDDNEFSRLLKNAAPATIHSVNDLRDSEDQHGLSIEHIEDSRLSQPIDHLMRKEIFCKLMGRNFTPLERKIVWLYYFEDRSMKEISEDVDLSESRVSQMHTKILERLRQRVELNPDFFDDIFDILPRFKGLVSTSY